MSALEQIRIDDHNFPHHLLEGCETALVMFCAAFQGRQDAFWVNEAGLTATCVDSDAERLADMSVLYPTDWEFVVADAFRFSAFDTTRRQWDVVTLDPFTNQMDECAASVGEWCRLARRAVVLGTGVGTRVVAPAGWVVTDVRKRTTHDGGVFWTILEPA